MTELKKIFQLEDMEGLALLSLELLGSKNIKVDQATNYEEAIQTLTDNKIDEYDAMLLDMGVPGKGNGSDVAHYVRKRGYKERIVMFSGEDMCTAKEKTSNLSNMSYLQKPCFSVDDIIHALNGEHID